MRLWSVDWPAPKGPIQVCFKGTLELFDVMSDYSAPS